MRSTRVGVLRRSGWPGATGAGWCRRPCRATSVARARLSDGAPRPCKPVASAYQRRRSVAPATAPVRDAVADPQPCVATPAGTGWARLGACARRRWTRGFASMYFDEFKHQLPDIDPAETDDWLAVPRPGRRAGRRDPRPVPRLQAPQAGAPAPDRPAAADPDALHQHDQPGAGADLPGRRGDGAAHPADHPLERGGDGPARQLAVRRDRRPPLDVRQLGQPVRDRLQPLLPGQGRAGQRRPDLLPGPRGPGHLRPGVPRGPPERGPARPLPARVDPGQVGPELVPASAPDARLLGVPDGVDGPRARSAPSTRPASTATCTTAACSTPAAPASGRSSATARPTSPSRSARSTSRRARASTT